ncbi:hypothetical protein Pelo_18848 [Pelomyxa schiedti]|nr:hypothetical protein Pelo_18848 [Pelomyxa schiedti]
MEKASRNLLDMTRKCGIITLGLRGSNSFSSHGEGADMMTPSSVGTTLEIFKRPSDDREIIAKTGPSLKMILSAWLKMVDFQDGMNFVRDR